MIEKKHDSQNKDIQETRRHEQINQLINIHFAKFDDRIKQTVRKYAFQNNGLQQLFKKIDTVMPSGIVAQLESIVKFINFYGEEEFRKRMLFSGENYNMKITPIFHPAPPNRPLEISSPIPGTQIPHETNKYQTEDEKKENFYYKDQPEMQALPQSHHWPAPQPSHSQPHQDHPAPEPEKSWPETDRRSGQERRKSQSRRKSVDLIFKNKRFGGERRSGLDRRKGNRK